MKKILVSLITMAVVSAGLVGSTSAYFTDTQTISGMTLATGTLEITDSSEEWMTHVTFENLKPGDTIRKWVVLTNTGTLDVASLNLTAAVDPTSPDPDLLKQIKLSVVGQVSGYDNAYYTPDWTTGAYVDGFLTTGVDLLTGTVYYTGGTPGTTMIPTATYTLILDFTVPTDMGNEWQGTSASFDLTFTAEQSHTPAAYF